jgi:hypothetical protein
MADTLQDKCNQEMTEMVKKYGMKNILEALILRVNSHTSNHTAGPKEYEIKLASNLQKTLDEYESRYEKDG